MPMRGSLAAPAAVSFSSPALLLLCVSYDVYLKCLAGFFAIVQVEASQSSRFGSCFVLCLPCPVVPIVAVRSID